MSDEYLYDKLQSFGVHTNAETAKLTYQRSLIAENMPQLSESVLREIQDLKRGDVPINSSESNDSVEETEPFSHPDESDNIIRQRITSSNRDFLQRDSMVKDNEDGGTTSINHIQSRNYVLTLAIVLLIVAFILIVFKQPLYLNVFQPFKRWISQWLEEAKKVADKIDHAEPILTPDII